MPFTLKDYADIREFATGGMSKIYITVQISLNRTVIIKEMAGGLLTSKNEIKRFENEARSGASLTHDNIIRIYDFGEEKGSFYIAMEYVDGPDLDQLLKQEDVPKELAMMVLQQALKGLAFAHEKGIVHRDVKPANMLISRNGAVKMVDFGLSYAGTRSGQLTTTGAIVGTPVYMSPELVNGEETKDRCMDIWAAGIILYRIITGELPFTGENVPSTLINIIQTKEKPAEELDRTLPPSIAVMLRSCLEKDHTKRLAVLSPLIEAMQNYFFEIGVRDPVDVIKKYFVDRAAAIRELRSLLFRYHLSKGKELSKTEKHATALAHFREAKKIEPTNKELSHSIRSLEEYIATTLTSRTATVQDYVVTQVRTGRRRARKKKGAPAFAAVLVLGACLAAGVCFVYVRQPEVWHKMPGMLDAVPHAWKGITQRVAAAVNKTVDVLSSGEKGGNKKNDPAVPAAHAGDPEKQKARPAENVWASALADEKMPDQKRPAANTDSGAVPPPAPAEDKGAVSQPAASSVTVSGNDTHRVVISLTAMEKKTGALQVVSDLAAEIYVDGELKGNSPTTVPIVLAEGQHIIVFKRHGFKPYEKTIVIRAGETRAVKVQSGTKKTRE